jgi:prevent-host-death family protein
MAEIGAFEAKNTFGSLLDRVLRGEEITITRHGVPVARLVPNSSRMHTAKLGKTDEDVVAMVRTFAARQNRSFDAVVTELTRGGFQETLPTPASRNGVPLLPGGQPVTPELVSQLREDLP